MLDTYYAPADRKTREEVRGQVEVITQNPLINSVLNSLGTVLVLLNEQRQVVALNNHFLEELGIDNAQEALGLRLGEILGCVHSREMVAGAVQARAAVPAAQ